MRTMPGFPVNQYHIDPAMDAGWLYIPLGETYSDWLDEDAVAMFQTGVCVYIYLNPTHLLHSRVLFDAAQRQHRGYRPQHELGQQRKLLGLVCTDHYSHPNAIH